MNGALLTHDEVRGAAGKDGDMCAGRVWSDDKRPESITWRELRAVNIMLRSDIGGHVVEEKGR